MKTLHCPKCGQDKPDDAFHAAKRNVGRRGRASYCKDCTRAAVRESKRKYPERNKTDRTYSREYARRRRSEAIAILGGVCVRCGESDEHKLHLDHIKGDGRKQSVNGHSRAPESVRRILAGDQGFQILCAPCHRIKTIENGDHLH